MAHLLYTARYNFEITQAEEGKVQITDQDYDKIEQNAVCGTCLENRNY